jgi:hypothetical protein
LFNSSNLSPTNYKLDVSINRVLILTDYDTALRTSSNNYSIKRFTTNNTCQMKITYSGPAYAIDIYSPNSALNTTAPYRLSSTSTTFIFNLTIVGTWSLVLRHSINTATSLITVGIILSTFSTNECLNFCSGKSNSLGLAPGTTNVCLCATDYVWNSTSRVCTINCSKIQYASGINPLNFSACLCVNNFIFDNHISRCIVNCNLISKATIIIPNTIDLCYC